MYSRTVVNTSIYLSFVHPVVLVGPCDAPPPAPPPSGSAGHGQPRSHERTGHAALVSPSTLAPAPGKMGDV